MKKRTQKRPEQPCYVGVDFYPEHWDRSLWTPYAKKMKAANFNVVRLAEFAWVLMEPTEGMFDFSWLDDAIRTLGRQGISVILGTPTAAMPAWVAQKYPDVLAMKVDGMRTVYGGRKNNCFSSGTFRMLSERITRAMAEHYAKDPNVIGWQTDNEFRGPTCYCSVCRREFQEWLSAKYRTLDALNRAWGTAFWGHIYGRWDEIQIPDDMNSQNPGICLDFKRFTSFLNVRFQREQIAVLRNECPSKFITHNLMGYNHGDVNYYDLAADLDFVSWDNYPVWGAPAVRYDASSAADIMRGLKKKNFWITEQTAGPCGATTFGRNVRPGELRSITYQQVAHGADATIWFRWRTATVGREQYWHGLLGHDGRALRRYDEAAQTARELHALWPHIAGTTVLAKVAIVYDYDSIMALKIQPGYEYQGHENFFTSSYKDAFKRYHRALFRAGVSVDVIKPDDPMGKYDLLLAPHQHVLSDDVAEKFNSYVKNGGVLFTDCRTGVKDEFNRCHARTLPGLLSKALGISIEEYEGVPGGVEYRMNGMGASYAGVRYADWITVRSARTLAGYDTPHMKGFAAFTCNEYGKGKGYYLGTIVESEKFYDAVIAELLTAAGIAPLCTPPPGVEVSIRGGDGKKILFVMNHTEETKTVPVPRGKTELITGKRTNGELTMDAFAVAVLKL